MSACLPGVSDPTLSSSAQARRWKARRDPHLRISSYLRRLYIKLGDEEITRDIPNRSEESLRNLDDRGIVRVGAEVGSGDLLVERAHLQQEVADEQFGDLRQQRVLVAVVPEECRIAHAGPGRAGT